MAELECRKVLFATVAGFRRRNAAGLKPLMMLPYIFGPALAPQMETSSALKLNVLGQVRGGQ